MLSEYLLDSEPAKVAPSLWDASTRADLAADKLAGSLGLTPQSRAALVRDLGQAAHNAGGDLQGLIAQGTAALERRQRASNGSTAQDHTDVIHKPADGRTAALTGQDRAAGSDLSPGVGALGAAGVLMLRSQPPRQSPPTGTGAAVGSQIAHRARPPPGTAPMDSALALLASFVLEDGRPIGEAWTEWQAVGSRPVDVRPTRAGEQVGEQTSWRVKDIRCRGGSCSCSCSMC